MVFAPSLFYLKKFLLGERKIFIRELGLLHIIQISKLYIILYNIIIRNKIKVIVLYKILRNNK